MKRFFIPYIYIVFCLWNFSALFSQNLTLKISVKDSINLPIIENLKYQKKHLTQESVLTEIDSLRFRFERIGFLNNQLDTIFKKDSIVIALFRLGNSNKLIRVYYDQDLVTKKMLVQISSKITNEYFEINLSNIPFALNSLVGQFEKKGNSFTEINLKNISIRNDTVSAQLIINISKRRVIDKIIIKGYEDFPQIFIKHYLNIKSTTIFNSEKLEQVSDLIKTIPFVTEIKPPEVLFTKDSTYLYLYVKKKKANKFDGLVGFASDQENSNLKFNGYLDLNLQNIFNGGESISLNWKNNGNDNQFFDLSTDIPFIFNSSLSPKFGLNIYRQDSTFINTKINLELAYALNFRNKISLAYVSETSSNLRDIAISDIETYTSNFFGARYNYIIVNNQTLHPIKLNFNLSSFFGNRKTNERTTQQYQFNLISHYLWALNFKNNIFIQNKSSILLSDDILTNELFRIGGVNSIRGFNEESIFASLYSILNIEYQYNTSNQSYLYSISDFGFVQNQLSNESQQLFSLGLGYAFSTNFGLLNLSYAIGKFNNQPFSFDNSRLHIKIISFF